MLRADDWVLARNCGWLHEADVIVAVLHAHGIDAFIPDAVMASMRPEFISFTSGVRVLVRSSQLELARAVLAAEEAVALPGRGMLMGDDDWA